MCGCEFNFTCTRCAGTWLDPYYEFLPDPDFERKQDREADMGRPDFLKPWENQR